ncbi:MAG TPA: ABC transporter substrate-binding protein [Candidatus Binatia bacterium]|jgi:ABC-type nitrate/sulfonate/bicarbonate transport system substrate-binding protein
MKKMLIAIAALFVMVNIAAAAEVNVPKPSGNLTLQIGHPSTISLYDVPSQITHERLNKQGWNIKSVEFTRTDFNTQALAQSTVQIALSQVLDPVRVIQGGGKLSYIMENNPGEFVLIAKQEIKDCKALDGKRFAIHGDTATTSLAAKLWLLNECKINPNVMVVPGGENRVIALQNNQIDGTLVQMGDWLNLDAKAPGKFHIINTGRLFNVSGMGVWANSDWVAKNEPVATAYIAESLKTFRMIHASPSIMEAAVQKYVPDTPKQTVAPAIKAYLEVVKAWPQNGGDTTIVEDTIKFFTERGELKPGIDVKQMVNPKILDGALKIIGKVPGQR